MKLAPAIAFAAALATPAAAFACPASGSCGGAMSGYVAALGVGLLAGMGSIAAEKLFRKR